MQGCAEVDRVQAADRGRPGGLSQDPDTRVEVDQVDLVQHGRQAGNGVWRISGERPE
jgi:hypothetical protein